MDYRGTPPPPKNKENRKKDQQYMKNFSRHLIITNDWVFASKTFQVSAWFSSCKFMTALGRPLETSLDHEINTYNY